MPYSQSCLSTRPLIVCCFLSLFVLNSRFLCLLIFFINVFSNVIIEIYQLVHKGLHEIKRIFFRSLEVDKTKREYRTFHPSQTQIPSRIAFSREFLFSLLPPLLFQKPLDLSTTLFQTRSFLSHLPTSLQTQTPKSQHISVYCASPFSRHLRSYEQEDLF